MTADQFQKRVEYERMLGHARVRLQLDVLCRRWGFRLEHRMHPLKAEWG